MWIWVVLGFVAGFCAASFIWIFRFRDKAPVGCLMEEYDVNGQPIYWLKYTENSISQISKARYVTFGVVHVDECKQKKGEER